ncbi:hypothetical protein Pelo_7797 [Pelomyxa schiedti]|nr:hypothetical protein Pelo_7797 [Pelomyxa schiedti]
MRSSTNNNNGSQRGTETPSSTVTSAASYDNDGFCVNESDAIAARHADDTASLQEELFMDQTPSRTTSFNSVDSLMRRGKSAGKGRRKSRRKRPVVLQVLLSISFIALMIAVLAALVPSFTLWATSLKGLKEMQGQSLNDAMTMRCTNIKTTVETNLNNCEKEQLSVAGWVGKKLDTRMTELGIANRSNPPLDLIVNETMFGSLTLDIYGQWATAWAVFIEEGMYLISSESDFGSVFLIQRGYGSNYSSSGYPYLPEEYSPAWSFRIDSPVSAFYYHAGLSDQILDTLVDSLYWGPLAIPHNSNFVTAELFAGLVLPSTKEMVGVIATGIMPNDFLNLFNDSITEGMLCAFIQDYDGCLVSSSCELASITVSSTVTKVCTINSTLWEVRDSSNIFETVLYENAERVMFFERYNYTVAYLRIQSNAGFKAVATVIADTHFFQQTYIYVKSRSRMYIVISIVIAVTLAGALSFFTFAGQLQVINRIRQISQESTGEIRNPPTYSARVYPDEEGHRVTATKSKFTNITACMKRLFTSLTEIQLILDKLEWLDGKVQIVVAFVPVISKLVCRQNMSDSAILESSLSRRLGCYLFCDIENFTPLCESVSPGTAAKLLELFYSTIERDAEATKHDLLVKRLGDGIFIAWGFQLEVEKTKSSSTPLPALAYAAALRIAESVEELSEHTRFLVGSQAPDWQFTLRIGITTGPALHGLLKTSTLINPDVVGAAVNLAARCQSAGKLPMLKELSKQELSPDGGADRVLCTIVSDLITFQANTHLAELHSHPPSSLSQHTLRLVAAAETAAHSLGLYKRQLVEDVPLQGIGNTTLGVTFVTLQKAHAHKQLPSPTLTTVKLS